MREKELWFDRLFHLFTQAKVIAKTYANPLMNDAGGSNDCDKILADIEHSLNILVTYHLNCSTPQKQSATIEGWVARYGSGELAIFEEKPYRLDNGNWNYDGGYLNFYTLPTSSFPDLKWEDEPRKVKLTIEEI